MKMSKGPKIRAILQSDSFLFQHLFKMSSAEALKRMDLRATATEKMIVQLRQEIEAVKAAAGGGGCTDYEAEMERVKKENASLKTQIEEWKGRLVKAEQRNGMAQVHVKGEEEENIVTVCCMNFVYTFVYVVLAPSSVDARVPIIEKPVVVVPVAPKDDSNAPKKEEKGKKGKPAAKKEEGKGEAAAAPEEAEVHVGRYYCLAYYTLFCTALYLQNTLPTFQFFVFPLRLDMRVGLIRSATRHPDADGEQHLVLVVELPRRQL